MTGELLSCRRSLETLVLSSWFPRQEPRSRSRGTGGTGGGGGPDHAKPPAALGPNSKESVREIGRTLAWHGGGWDSETAGRMATSGKSRCTRDHWITPICCSLVPCHWRFSLKVQQMAAPKERNTPREKSSRLRFMQGVRHSTVWRGRHLHGLRGRFYLPLSFYPLGNRFAPSKPDTISKASPTCNLAKAHSQIQALRRDCHASCAQMLLASMLTSTSPSPG